MRSTKTKVGARKSAHPSNSADIDSIPRKQPTVHAADSNLAGQERSFADVVKTVDDPVKSRRSAIPEAAGRPNLGRHAANCRICAHPKRQEIEDNFVDWHSAARIAREYRLADRSSVYRHAHALNLFPKRGRNLRTALGRIIEQAGDVEANPSGVVVAIVAYGKLNEGGQWIEPDQNLELHDLFDRMSLEEYDGYAKNGTRPTWFQDEITAAGGRVPKGGNDA